MFHEKHKIHFITFRPLSNNCNRIYVPCPPRWLFWLAVCRLVVWWLFPSTSTYFRQNEPVATRIAEWEMTRENPILRVFLLSSRLDLRLFS